jgi:outer membrane murein-binding lipoprotein Lpp
MTLPRRKPTLRSLIEALSRKVDHMATTVEEVQASLTTLTTDLEGLASTAQAEFAKLEQEVSEGTAQPDLGPLKASIDAIDAKVKSAASDVPSS